jgi:hypothetical protein
MKVRPSSLRSMSTVLSIGLGRMQVFIPAIVGYVPDNVVKCISAFLDAAYIARRQDINTQALNNLQAALDRFQQLREVFRTSGVRPSGFSLPRQHALFHYHHLIEDFGAPGGLCSSITESRHITAVKKPWRQSNQYEALGQMLRINQRLDKLGAMRSDFIACGMLPGGQISRGHMSLFLNPSAVGLGGEDEDDKEAGPVEGDDVLAHVILAQARGT